MAKAVLIINELSKLSEQKIYFLLFFCLQTTRNVFIYLWSLQNYLKQCNIFSKFAEILVLKSQVKKQFSLLVILNKF